MNQKGRGYHINYYTEVLKQASIVGVLKYYNIDVHNHKAMCCFHNDSNPSMMVNEKKQIAKCFACGTGGNAISFVQKYEKEVNHNEISLNDAIIKVAEICNIDIDLSKIKKMSIDTQYTTTIRKYNQEEKDLIEVNQHLGKLFNYNLISTKNDAIKYLHDRGLSDELIKEMNLGFIPKGQIKRMAENPNSKIKLSDLRELGLVRTDGLNIYEVFEDRVMFPITDEKGNIITFAGRTIKDETPKYLHTSENKLFHKKEILYNYSNAKNYSYNDELILVEGYMDVIGAKKLGIDNVVALMGTALTDEHLELLKRNHCSLTFALDNDDAGRNAMINKIPELLKKGFKVEVLDISKLGNYKDFGDLGNSELSREDIQKAKMSSFDFMMDYYYFRNKEYTVENIYEIFETARKDEFIKSTLQEAMFVEYILKKTSYTKDDMEDIIHPKSISNSPMKSIQDIAMNNLIVSGISENIKNKNDKIINSYYEINRDKINENAFKVFQSDDTKYLQDDYKTINFDLLLQDVLSLDSSYSEYETLHKFKYENVFDKTFIKNINGSAKVNLNFEQKKAIIKQYEDSLRNEDKLALEEVEELYIINDPSDLDGILSYNNKTMEIIKGNIQDRITLNKNQMQFFKYGNLFLNIDKEFISPEFKGKTGNFKTVLFFNNLSGILELDKKQLSKDYVIDNSSKQEIEETKEPEVTKEESKDYIFSINKMLVVDEYETDSEYFVRIPNTEAKDYFYLDKSECNWSDNGEMMFTRLEAGKTYRIYDRDGNFKCEKNAEQLQPYWEDKTDKKILGNNTDTVEQENKQKRKIYNQPYFPNKEPICKVFKSKIVTETDNGYYFSTKDEETILFASKKICNWNQDNRYLIIHPKKNKIFGSGLSKYVYEGSELKYKGKISLNDLSQYISVFNPATSYKAKKDIIRVLRSDCEIKYNFLKVPVVLDSVSGYVEVNIVKTHYEGDDVVIELSPHEQLCFYSKDGSYIGNYISSDIKKGLETESEKILIKDKNTIDFEDLITANCEKVFCVDDDVLEFIPHNIESGYEFFETVTWVKLNNNYLYKPEGVNVAPYKNVVKQRGALKNKGEVVAFLKTYFKNRNLELQKNREMEREVA